MEIQEFIKVGSSLTVSFKGSEKATTWESSVTKIKEELVAITIPSTTGGKEDFPVGKELLVEGKSGEQLFSGQGAVASNKTFPVIVMKVKNIRHQSAREKPPSPRDQEDHSKEAFALSEESNKRNSARIDDQFSVSFFRKSKEEAEAKSKDYHLRPTFARRESPSISPSLFAPLETEQLASLSHLDPQVVEILKDIYKRVNFLTARLGSASLSEEDSSLKLTGLCVDVSGTGLKIVTTQKLKVGDFLKIIIAPPHAIPPFSISALVEVMNVEELGEDEEGNPKYSGGVRYYAIHEDDAEQITHYTFQLQQELLRIRRAERDLEEAGEE